LLRQKKDIHFLESNKAQANFGNQGLDTLAELCINRLISYKIC